MHIAPLARRPFALALLLACAAPAFAAEQDWLGAADCRIAPLKPVPEGAVSWTGACVDGCASGKGVLAWTSAALGKVTLEATFVRGEASGEALLKRRDYLYEGTTRNGLPHGEGYFQYENGRGWYEGQVADGRPHGQGTHLAFDRSRYTGQWVAGRRHGRGEARYATGGSYAGDWKDNNFDGQGAIVYAGAGHKYKGVFQDGRVAGLPKAEVAEASYAIKDGVSGEDAVRAYLPVKARWDELTPAQKNTFRRNYPALEAGDEPPLPVKGEGPVFDKVVRMNQLMGGVRGLLSVYVLVGKDGKPLSVTAYGAPSATFVRALSTLFMLEQYKPALCRGEPCEMVYPVNFSFTVTD